MKKVFSLVFSLALMLGLAFAQDTGGSDTGGADTGGSETLGSGVIMGESGGVGRLMGQDMTNLTFADVDTNGDGSIDQMEFDAAMSMMGGESGGAMMGETGGAMMGETGGMGDTGGAMMGETGGAMMGNTMMKPTFADVDTNGDGSIDQMEFDAIKTKMMGSETGGSMMGRETGGGMMSETGGMGESGGSDMDSDTGGSDSDTGGSESGGG